ncbi:hypothetical protein Prudu_006874 [Prunus dulcis]|uniref:Uncharacterized protein n=1 Tax=Prunus dulcis TaxID=3755 RepID=A0A4Y1R0N5_PRUDU|nr:hypothetical protein Prudu_006874 [Prunus dulcis]
MVLSLDATFLLKSVYGFAVTYSLVRLGKNQSRAVNANCPSPVRIYSVPKPIKSDIIEQQILPSINIQNINRKGIRSQEYQNNHIRKSTCVKLSAKSVAQRQQNEIRSSKFAQSKIRITYLRPSSKSASRCNDGLYTASLAAPSRLYLLEPEPCILSVKKKAATPSLAECSCKFVASLRLGACGFPRELRKEPKTNFLDSTKCLFCSSAASIKHNPFQLLIQYGKY